MTKSTIRHICGHSAEYAIFGTNAQRQRKKEAIAARLCPNCAAEQAAAEAKAQGLPEPTGSPKQAAWACDIRAEHLRKIDRLETWVADRLAGNIPPAAREQGEAAQVFLADLRREYQTKTTASWFIDRRDVTLDVTWLAYATHKQRKPNMTKTFEQTIAAIGAARFASLSAFNPATDTVSVDFGGLYETRHDMAIRDAELSEFASKYMAAYPDDEVFAAHVEQCGLTQDDHAAWWGVGACTVFDESWTWDYRKAAALYLERLLDFVNDEYGVQFKLQRINWTRDNFSRPDLAVLEPIGIDGLTHIKQWLADNPEHAEAVDKAMREATTPRDGYIPYYTYDQVRGDDGFLVKFAIERMIDSCCGDDYTSTFNWFEWFESNMGLELPDCGEITAPE